MADIMLDLETLGTAPGCVIRSIGACAFDPAGNGVVDRTFYVIVNRASCEAAGLTVDPKTEKWWSDQSPEARAEFDGHGVELATALDLFDVFYREHSPPAELKSDKLWCNGPSFDETILGAAYRTLGRETPWRYNAARDCRTIFDLTGLKLRHTEGVFHKADDDAKEQALLVQEAWRILFIDQSPTGRPSKPVIDMTTGSEVPGPITRQLVESWELHHATAALVNGFAWALAEKLAKAQAKYGYTDGWRRDDWEAECRASLMEHIAKGDPRDVAAYCAFMWRHGWSTAPATGAKPEREFAQGGEVAAAAEHKPDAKVTIGLIMAATIVAQGHGEDTIAEDILTAAGVTSTAAAVAAGADPYDLDGLKPVFAELERKAALDDANAVRVGDR